MKRTLINLVLITAVAISGLCSCSNNASDNSGNDLDYITLSELPNNIEVAKSAKYDSLSLDEHIKINIPEKISEMNIKGKKPDLEIAQKLVDHYGLSDKITVKDNPDPHSEMLIQYREGDEDSSDLIFNLSKLCGLNYHTEKIKASDPVAAANEPKKRIYVDSLKEDDTFTIDGKTVYAKALISQASDFINDFASTIGAAENVPVYIDYSEYDSRVYFTRKEHGYYQPFCTAKISSYKDVAPEQEAFIVSGEQCRVLYRSAGKPSGLYEHGWQTTADFIGKEYDKMVSLTYALNYVDDKLADNLKCNVDHICIIQLKKDRTIREVSGIEELDFNAMQLDFDTHPYWQFVMHSTRNEAERFAALIDCTTGEFYFSKIN